MSTASIAPVREHPELPVGRAHPPRSGFVLRALDADRWSLAGELDCSSGPMLLPTAEAAFPTPPVLYLECSDVDFVDVAGWRALHAVRSQFEPATELRLCHPSAALRRLISVLGHP